MKLKDTLIAWNPGGEIQVGPLANNRHWSTPYFMTSGGCYTEVAKARGDKAKAFVLAEFIAIVLHDGISLGDAHREFSKIDEYRNAIPADVVQGLATPPWWQRVGFLPPERPAKPRLSYIDADTAASLALSH
jgi:hypothetical protein